MFINALFPALKIIKAGNNAFMGMLCQGNYIDCFVNNGLEIYLKPSEQGGARSKLSVEQQEELKTAIAAAPLVGAKAVVEVIKKVATVYSLSEARYLLGKLRFSFKKTTLIPCKTPSVEVQEAFVQRILALSDRLKTGEYIYFVDGVHPQHNTRSQR